MTIAIDVNRPYVQSARSTEFLNDKILPGQYFALADEREMTSFGIWLFNGQDAHRVDYPRGMIPPRIEVPVGRNLIDSVRATPLLDIDYFTVQRLELPPGAFYPGIARPDIELYGYAAFQAPDFSWRRRELISSLLQLRSLYRSLETIFQVVHPHPANLSVFGSSIRELIILASTECEAQWKAVLKLNNYHRDRPTRSDYQKLGGPMRLGEFTVALQHYQDIEMLTPFAGWDSKTVGAPLPWYDDYNAVKHDRAGSFTRATLASALNAVAACWVMIAAQYGYRALRELPDLQENMRIQYAPRWRLAECYLADGHGFSPDAEQAYPF